MSWIAKNNLTWIQSLVISILKSGHIPKHVAFIMDGNRRFANKKGVEKIEGHMKGFDKLAETLSWCLQFGISEVTVYAFSIENFKRTKEEVDALMDLAKQKFQRLLDEKDKLMEHGVCVKVIGNFSLIPPDLRAVINEAIQTTKLNTKAYLNIAFCYTSRDEITCTIRDIAKNVVNGEINKDDIDENLISQCLYTHNSASLDLLIRTSGEVRLSDFLLWQTSFTCVYFCKVLWPEFSIWDLISAIFYYQRCYRDLEKIKKHCENNNYVPSIKTFGCINKVHNEREAVLTNS